MKTMPTPATIFRPLKIRLCSQAMTMFKKDFLSSVPQSSTFLSLMLTRRLQFEKFSSEEFFFHNFTAVAILVDVLTTVGVILNLLSKGQKQVGNDIGNGLSTAQQKRGDLIGIDFEWVVIDTRLIGRFIFDWPLSMRATPILFRSVYFVISYLILPITNRTLGHTVTHSPHQQPNYFCFTAPVSATKTQILPRAWIYWPACETKINRPIDSEFIV